MSTGMLTRATVPSTTMSIIRTRTAWKFPSAARTIHMRDVPYVGMLEGRWDWQAHAFGVRTDLSGWNSRLRVNDILPECRDRSTNRTAAEMSQFLRDPLRWS